MPQICVAGLRHLARTYFPDEPETVPDASLDESAVIVASAKSRKGGNAEAASFSA